ncbi:MAG: glycosyltransferase family 4 protein [Synechococcaceae cyanobacterium SM2_3_1]|nr:glycosyltransferase family 4 protein [Synechococcaceae cyanobacterium SM2_3_1]
MMSTKICITSLEFPPDVGGVGESVCRIARMLTQSGYEVHVAVFNSKQARSAEGLLDPGCHTSIVEGIHVHRIHPYSHTGSLMIQDYLSQVHFHLKQLHHQHQFSLFHGFFINETGFVTTLLAREIGIPVINSIRGSDLHRHVFDPKQFGSILWVLENSDWVTAVSRDLLKRAQTLVPSIRRHSTAFWNSIAPIDFAALPTPELVQQLRGPVIGSLGRFRQKKGLEFLLDACASLRQEWDFTLLLVGDFAVQERDYWQNLIETLGLRDRVVVTGFMERLQALAYLPHMDIFTLPSLHDGCPNALLEAMLAGRAVVGTSSDAIGEILQHEHNGLVVPAGNSVALTWCLGRLLRLPVLRQKLGTQARLRVLKDLAPAVEQQNWLQIYEEVLGSPRIRHIA